ncbi:hypothetical protein FQN53_008372 [Emmonsiellopsis sp. PD_33]|nr:hypothetical protein FQN53_008372 [Emmonsiellopsis sp. PD_33]
MPSIWPYRYTSPTPSQLQERRNLLTLRGEYAQVSALVFLFLFSVYRYATASARKASRSRSRSVKKSWLDSPLSPQQGPETCRQYLVATAWLVWLIVLSAWRTGNDHLHLTKSLAHTTLATFPFQLLLSPKLSPATHPLHSLLLTPILNLPQTALTPYHRLFGHLVLPTLLSLHAALYITFFVQNDLLARRVGDLDVQWGVTGVVLLWVVVSVWSPAAKRGVQTGAKAKVKAKEDEGREEKSEEEAVKRPSSSSSSASSKKQRTAYIVHVSLVMSLLGVAYFHVKWARKFVWQCLALYAVDVGSYAVRGVVGSGKGRRE